MIYLLDLGSGNTDRIIFTLSKLNHKVIPVSAPFHSNPSDILIIPGVGSFDSLMQSICKLDLIGFLHDWYAANKKIISICAGFQILFEGSEESDLPGLAILPGSFSSLSSLHSNKSLNVGFNSLFQDQNNNCYPLLSDHLLHYPFYFTHSFLNTSLTCTKNADLYFSNAYEIQFLSAYISSNIFGFQFHPELSHSQGLQLLNFILS